MWGANLLQLLTLGVLQGVFKSHRRFNPQWGINLTTLCTGHAQDLLWKQNYMNGSVPLLYTGLGKKQVYNTYMLFDDSYSSSSLNFKRHRLQICTILKGLYYKIITVICMVAWIYQGLQTSASVISGTGCWLRIAALQRFGGFMILELLDFKFRSFCWICDIILELCAQQFWQAGVLGIVERWMNSLTRWRVSVSRLVCGRRAETRCMQVVYPSLKLTAPSASKQ